jgi:hypothetical protein
MIKHPQTQISHCPQCADKENTNVVQRGMKDKPRRHGAGGGAEGPVAGGSLSMMARNISWTSSLS